MSGFVILGTHCQTCGGLVIWREGPIYGMGNEKIGFSRRLYCDVCGRTVDPDGASAMSAEWESVHTTHGNKRRPKRCEVTA